MRVAQVVGRLCGEQLLGVLDTNNYQKAEIRNKYMQVIQGDDNSQDSDSNIYTSSIYC